jgi:hypothetical protein
VSQDNANFFWDATNHRLGIGAAPTTPRLTVAQSGTDWTGYFQSTAAAGSNFGLDVIAGYNASDTSFQVVNGAATAVYFKVRGDGNVGIGTTSPSALLDIRSGSASTDRAFKISPANNANVELYAQRSDNGDLRTLDVNCLDFNIISNNGGSGTGANHFIVQGSTGNVGIGMVTPQNTLTIAQTGVVSSSPGIDFFATISTGTTALYNSGRIYTHFDADNYPGARLTLAYPTGGGTFADGLSLINGHVGIGTTAPGTYDSTVSKLEVATASGNAQVAINAPSGSESNLVFAVNSAELWRINVSSANGFRMTDNGNLAWITFFSSTITLAQNTSILGSLTVSGLSGGTSGRAVLADTAGLLSAPVSDMRLKLDVLSIKDSLATVTALRGVSFKWDTANARVKNYGAGREVGLIAQEVAKVLPEAVFTNGDGYMGVHYDRLVSVLIEAVKEQQKQIDELKAQIN